MHYQTRYEERHPTISETAEARMINSYIPKKCPFCSSEDFVKIGYDSNGIRRYKCTCGKKFKPTTGTIFNSRKISVSEWIEYCLNIFRYISLNADSWNNRNAITTSKYWLEKLFLTLDGYQNDIVLSGDVLCGTGSKMQREINSEGFHAIRFALALPQIKPIQSVSWKGMESHLRRAASTLSKIILLQDQR